MGSTNGVKMNWPVVAIAFAVIGVPMGVAVIQDLGSDTDEEALARIGEVAEIAEVSEAHDEADDDEADDEAGRWEQPAMEQAFFDEVFLGGPDDDEPALRGLLLGYDWGAPPAHTPELRGWPRARVSLASYGTLTGRTNEMVVSFPDDGTAARVFASRWGEPRLAVGNDDLTRRIWTNPADRLRLVLESHDGEARVRFSPYAPAADYVAGNRRFAFETHPILGATPDQLVGSYGNVLHLDPGGSTGQIDCPGVELSAHAATCALSFAGGRVVKVTVTIDHALDPQAGPQVFAALRDALGTVREQASDDTENRWTFDHGYTMTQRVGQPVITVVRVAR